MSYFLCLACFVFAAFLTDVWPAASRAVFAFGVVSGLIWCIGCTEPLTPLVLPDAGPVASCPPGHELVYNDSCEFCFDCIPRVEVCDGVDNDGDGIVDNNGQRPLSEYCGAAVLAPCRVGVRTCTEGAWSPCYGAVNPIPETGYLACDGIDNDCDGCVDSKLVGGYCSVCPPTGADIVYIVDVSGSMGPVLSAVLQATRLHAQQLSAAYYRFALILVGTETPPFFRLETDFTLFEPFNALLQQSHIGAGGDEPQYDAVVAARDLSYRSGTKRIIVVFSDENGQGEDYDEQSMCDALDHGEMLAVLTKHPSDFDDCARVLPLETEPGPMLASLQEIAVWDVCQ
jgi:hypothetical protein